MSVSIKKLSSPKKNARSRFCCTIHKPVWVGAFPVGSSTHEPEGRVLREAKLLLLKRYKDLHGIYPGGYALIEMRKLAHAAANGLDYVQDEKLLKKFLRKRITKLVNDWGLSDWKRKRQSRGGETEVLSYGAALGWKIDREKAAEYTTQIGERREAERVEDLKYHLFELLPDGKDRQRFEALVCELDALDFDSVGNIAIGSHTTLRQTAKDLSEICGVKTDDKALARLIDKLRKLSSVKITRTRPRINKAVIKQAYGQITSSAERTVKEELAASDRPPFTLATGKYQPAIEFPENPQELEEGDLEPLKEAPVSHGRIGKALEGFRDSRSARGKDVGPAAQELEEELKGLVDGIPSGAPGKKMAALTFSIWYRYHHHMPENCRQCAQRIERIRQLAAKCGKNF